MISTPACCATAWRREGGREGGKERGREEGGRTGGREGESEEEDGGRRTEEEGKERGGRRKKEDERGMRKEGEGGRCSKFYVMLILLEVKFSRMLIRYFLKQIHAILSYSFSLLIITSRSIRYFFNKSNLSYSFSLLIITSRSIS